MAGKLIEDASLRDMHHVFRDRSDAGRRLARFLKDYIRGDELVFAIPSGGLPVALEVAKAHSLPMDLLIARKIQIPGNTEAGFGAVAPDGTRMFNEPLLSQLRLSEREIDGQIKKAMETIRHRDRVFRGSRPFPDILGKRVIIVDDGLASGYTMLVSLGYLRKRKPAAVLVAVPTCFQRTADRVSREADALACLNVRGGYSFAVADAFVNWYDLADEEVESLIKQAG